MAEYMIGEKDDFPEGEGVAVKIGHRELAVFRIGDEFYALANRCPHKGASMCEGEVLRKERVVRCPWHHWNWQLTNGLLETNANFAIRDFEIEVDNGIVIIRI